MKGAVRLYRKWWVPPDWVPFASSQPEHLLRGVLFASYVYRPGVNYATDMAVPGAAVGEGAGIYGYLSIGDVGQFHGALSRFEVAFYYPLGTILGFGRVRVFERGAVCERAVVESLILPERAGFEADEFRWIRDRYQKLADFYECMLLPFEVAAELPTGPIEGQPIRGV